MGGYYLIEYLSRNDRIHGNLFNGEWLEGATIPLTAKVVDSGLIYGDRFAVCCRSFSKTNVPMNYSRTLNDDRWG